MSVSILTCDRKPSYLDGTLASLRATAPDVEPKIIRDEWDRALPPTQRLTLSFRKALLEAGGDALIFEDDVEFRADWQARLAAAMERLDALKGGRARRERHYFLACYAPHLFVGEPVSPYIRAFYGTQGCFVPANLIESLTDYLDKHQAEATLDALISRWTKAEGVRLFAIVPSLVQHVGIVSALGDPLHSSPMWNDP